MVIAACGNMSQGLDLVLMLMTQFKEPVPVTEDIIIAACHAQVHHHEILQYLFDHHVQGQFQLTEPCLIAAAGNRHMSTATNYLLNGTLVNFVVTPAVIKVACTNDVNGLDYVDYLFKKPDSKIPIDEDILCAAAANKAQGFDLLSLLLQYQPESFHITEDLLNTAARNEEGETKILDLLSERCTYRSTVTDKLLQTAMLFRPHDIPALALSDGDPHGRINEETLVFAARYSHPNMLSKLLKRSNQQITGAVLEAAARNVNGIATLTWLLGRLFDPAVIAPGLVAGATQNARHGGDFIGYLQSRYPCQTRAAVNEKAVLAAASSRQISFLDMLEQRYSITVTEEHRSIARLRHASLANDLRTVQDLLATSVHPDYPDGAGRTPLRFASKRGFLKIVQERIGTGRVDVNAQDDLGQTPLLVAVLHEHHDLIYPLMEAGADPDLRDSCRDTLHSVAEKAGDYISLRRLREGAKLRAVREIQK